MRAEELRIGNYVYYNDKVISITPNAINELYYIGDTHSESLVDRRCYEPIELTEEILLKCGFEKHSTNPFWFRKKQICISLVGSIELISWDMQVFKIDSKAENIHKLQNLYYALTGEELNVQL